MAVEKLDNLNMDNLVLLLNYAGEGVIQRGEGWYC
jgi:hypothetical protein